LCFSRPALRMRGAFPMLGICDEQRAEPTNLCGRVCLEWRYLRQKLPMFWFWKSRLLGSQKPFFKIRLQAKIRGVPGPEDQRRRRRGPAHGCDAEALLRPARLLWRLSSRSQNHGGSSPEGAAERTGYPLPLLWGRSNSRILGHCAKAEKQYPDSPSRHTIAHSLLITDPDGPRFKELNVTMQTSP
jgi:hypothetical protein